MLTVDISSLTPGAPSRLFMLEFDMEYRRVQAFGQGDVCYSRSGRGDPYLESGETGGCYTGPQTIADVELWNAEEHFLAVFPDEESMRAGGLQLAGAGATSCRLASTACSSSPLPPTCNTRRATTAPNPSCSKLPGPPDLRPSRAAFPPRRRTCSDANDR
jgi:hypothetical protein